VSIAVATGTPPAYWWDEDPHTLATVLDLLNHED
jgi:hypothetical protein